MPKRSCGAKDIYTSALHLNTNLNMLTKYTHTHTHIHTHTLTHTHIHTLSHTHLEEFNEANSLYNVELQDLIDNLRDLRRGLVLGVAEARAAAVEQTGRALKGGEAANKSRIS